MSNWVKEEISLSSYTSSQVKIQFQLKTDPGVTRDGWYLDDIGIFIYSIPTEISNEDVGLYQFDLKQNYPNPFNPTTTIKYSVPSNGKNKMANVVLKVFDVLGNEIATLINEEKPAGNYEVGFDAAGLTSGIYFYKLQSGSFVDTKKMLLLK
jgi:hypothetical protein